MDVSRLPFNQRVGIAAAEGTEGGLALPESAETLNHLGTVHASAQFALAEAASGQYLVDTFPTLAGQALAVVRSFSGKYRGAARGLLRSKAEMRPEEREKFETDLQRRGRATVPIEVEVRDAAGSLTLSARFEWFVQLGSSRDVKGMG